MKMSDSWKTPLNVRHLLLSIASVLKKQKTLSQLIFFHLNCFRCYAVGKVPCASCTTTPTNTKLLCLFMSYILVSIFIWLELIHLTWKSGLGCLFRRAWFPNCVPQQLTRAILNFQGEIVPIVPHGNYVVLWKISEQRKLGDLGLRLYEYSTCSKPTPFLEVYLYCVLCWFNGHKSVLHECSKINPSQCYREAEHDTSTKNIPQMQTKDGLQFSFRWWRFITKYEV